ncbi:MAG TPA: hypothetical protein VGO57_10285 [Verrucomicrobiae bacterium]|jgi:hypothetical protein
MFHLESAVAEWRNQMLAAGVQSPVPLEELEAHLREEVEQQVKLGLGEQSAFEITTSHLGQPHLLKREFKKIERNNMKLVLILIGIFGILTGPAIILPALAQHRNLGIWNNNIIWPIIIGAIITLAGVGTAVLGFKKQKT